MALDFLGYDPYEEEGRLRRAARIDSIGGQGSPYTGRPVVNYPSSVSNPNPVSVPVTSFPNQTNLDPSIAYPLFERFEGYVNDQAEAGLDWMPLPTPYYTYNESRDPTTGDYLSRNVSADYSGMAEPLVDFAKWYAEPVQGRLARGIGTLNDARHVVTDNSQISHYTDPRTGIATPYPFLTSARPGASAYDPVYY